MYQRIYSVVGNIPAGKVATYGQVAGIAGGCSPRHVGYALSALPEGHDIPWHRVINWQGRISPRSFPGGDLVQRHLLEAEGVVFNDRNQVDLERFGWDPVWQHGSSVVKGGE
ncbi:MAG: MGMT family protein [bacterium]